MTTIVDRIRAERKRLGLSQESLAEACDVHRGTIADIERGKQSPSLDTLYAIAKATGKPMEYFISGVLPSHELEEAIEAARVAREASQRLADLARRLEALGGKLKEQKGKKPSNVVPIYERRAADGGFGPDKPHKDGCHSRVACIEEKGEVYSVDGERADLGLSDDDGGQSDNRS